MERKTGDRFPEIFAIFFLLAFATPWITSATNETNQTNQTNDTNQTNETNKTNGTTANHTTPHPLDATDKTEVLLRLYERLDGHVIYREAMLDGYAVQ